MSTDPPRETKQASSRAGDRVLACKERILTRWVERLRREVPAATDELEPTLINTFPALLRNLSEALTPEHPRRIATQGSTIAQEHGGERVRLTRFRLNDVLLEYKLLREVLVEVLEQTSPLTPEERNTLHSSLDVAILEAATAYVLVQEGFRERFVATLAHDLRGPLSAAKTNAALVHRSPGSDNVPRWASRCVDNIDRADRMIQDLLDVMRSEAVGRAPLELVQCDLVELARTAVLQEQTEHGERLLLQAEAPVVGYFAPEPMRRAVANLVTNAFKYGAADRPVTLHLRQTHGRAILRVHNHGSFIPVDQQETLFRAFHRNNTQGATREKSGWGLGLAQVRDTAESHGGSITVDSLPESGTTFTLDVPVDARPFQEKPTTPGS